MKLLKAKKTTVRSGISTLCYAVFCLILMTLVSCTMSTNIAKIKVSGRILLDGASDNSGITVAIYPLDSNINSDQDLINAAAILNVDISQNRVFNHKMSVPIAIAQTDMTGSFNLEITKGDYNIVLLKEGFGYRYLCQKNLSEDCTLISVNNGVEITLYPDVVFSGVYEGSYIFSRNSHTVIADNTSFIAESEVIVEPGATVRIAADKNLNFYGAVKMRGEPDQPIHVRVDANVYDINISDSQVYFDKIQFLADSITQDGIIDYVVFTDMLNGVKTYQDSSVKNCTFIGGYETLMSNYADNVQLENNLFLNRSTTAIYSVNIGLSSNVSLRNNIFWKNSNGLQAYATTGLTIENNYFNNSDICAYLHHEVTAVFTHNTMETAGVAVTSYISCNTEYYYNDVAANIGLKFGGTYDYGKVNNNNLNCSSHAIEYISYHSGDMDAKNNYFYTSELGILANLIWDKSDYATSHSLYDILNYVVYTPFKSNPVPGAGVQ